MAESAYVVGIDLGTTHCALSSAAIQRPAVRLMKIPQLVASGEVAGRDLLPSFLYLPAQGELTEGDRALPWGASPRVVGQFARALGAKVPGRLVASAKSWVCHGGVNRRAPILPWAAPDEQPHVSPYEAQVAYLDHVRAAWEHAHPDTPLRDQDVVVTVPASFDEGARELTSQAAAEAGLGEVRLLEEPQAAFYDFVGANRDALGDALGDARLILVVDIGGGTTDLTLLRVVAGDGDPRIERIAVGGHLMLGGDNMDATLAIHALQAASIERPEDATVWSALVQSARTAKERLLSADAPQQSTITFQRRGSRLIGNTRSLTVDRGQAQAVLLDGFFPHTGPADVATRSGRAGLTTLGLPYTSDTAVPRHICTFLRRHAHAAQEAGAEVRDGLPRPDLLLLNGGVFNAPAIIERLSEVLAGWFGGQPIGLLEHTSLDTAVAHGAVRAGLARRGIGEVIGGGTARAYYIGIEGPDGAQQAMCIAPRGMDDGSSLAIPERVFELRLDRPVTFPLIAYTGDRIDPAGTLIDLDPQDESQEPLPPLATVLRDKGGSAAHGSGVGVTLTATLTDTGALELYLVTVTLPPRRWRLDFSLPTAVAGPASGASDHSPGPDQRTDQHTDERPDPKIADALGVLTEVLSGDDSKAVKGLRRAIEKILGPRGQWSAATCRALWDGVMEAREHRGRSEQHELVWLRLCGWCLRPGFGAPGDDARLDAMWSLREQGLTKRSKANWSQWWITWRQIAAGLDAPRQRALFEDVRPWLWRTDPPPPGPHAHGPVEMMQLLAALERLPATTKRDAGQLLLERANKVGSYWPVGRVGARVLFHGTPDDIVPSAVAQQWLQQLLELDWDKSEGAAFAAASIARLTGDAQRDVDETMRATVAERLAAAKAPASWVDMVVRGLDLSAGDIKRVFGDSLPVGLRLT